MVSIVKVFSNVFYAFLSHRGSYTLCLHTKKWILLWRFGMNMPSLKAEKEGWTKTACWKSTWCCKFVSNYRKNCHSQEWHRIFYTCISCQMIWLNNWIVTWSSFLKVTLRYFWLHWGTLRRCISFMSCYGQLLWLRSFGSSNSPGNPPGLEENTRPGLAEIDLYNPY